MVLMVSVDYVTPVLQDVYGCETSSVWYDVASQQHFHFVDLRKNK